MQAKPFHELTCPPEALIGKRVNFGTSMFSLADEPLFRGEITEVDLKNLRATIRWSDGEVSTVNLMSRELTILAN